MGKKKKRVEDIKVTDATDESQLSEEDLEEVDGGLVYGTSGSGMGRSGRIATIDTSLTQLEETSLEDAKLDESSLGIGGITGLRGRV